MKGQSLNAEDLQGLKRPALQRFRVGDHKKNKYEVSLSFTADGIRCDNEKLQDIVAPVHWDALRAASNSNGLSFSIRETGPKSRKRILGGAKTKPHSILEKSIKESSVRKGYPENFEDVMKRIEDLDLDGFVGHWAENGELLGLRMDDCPPACAELCRYAENPDGILHPYLPVDLTSNTGGEALETFKNNHDWKTILYTGDYDLLELHQHNKLLTEGSNEKARALSHINAKISEFDPLRKGSFEVVDGQIHLKDDGYAMIKHGDQATYVANQYIEAKSKGEKTAKAVLAVAKEDPGLVATFHHGRIYITENIEQLHELREQLGLKTPSHWLDNAIEARTTLDFGKDTKKKKRSSLRARIDEYTRARGGSTDSTLSGSGVWTAKRGSVGSEESLNGEVSAVGSLMTEVSISSLVSGGSSEARGSEESTGKEASNSRESKESTGKEVSKSKESSKGKGRRRGNRPFW